MQITFVMEDYSTVWLLHTRMILNQMWSSQQAAELYRKTSNISRTLVGNKIVDNSDVVQQHLHSQLNTWLQWTERRQLQEDTRNF